MKYLSSASLQNKSVLVRLDLNTPLKDGRVLDAFRIESALPTLKHLLAQNCKIVILSHLGRPKGNDSALSLKPVAEHLAHLLKLKFVSADRRLPSFDKPHLVFWTGDIRKTAVRKIVAEAGARDVIFLENIRFYEEEEANSGVFAKQLSEMGEVFVNDAFSVDHHPSVSTFGVAKLLPSFAGFVLEREITQLKKVLQKPAKPFVALLAGIKISDKEKTVENLAKTADHILLGGGLANMIFLSRGFEVGLSKVEKESESLAWHLDKSLKHKLVLPMDVVVAEKSLDKNTIRVCLPYEVRKNELILDIGPKTILLFSKFLKSAKTIVWNGPLGLFEKRPFHSGTMAMAQVIGSRAGKKDCFAVVGGGETVDAIRQAGQAEHIDHLSTGGGAMLEFLAGKDLPGIEALG